MLRNLVGVEIAALFLPACSRPLPALEHSIQSNVDNGSYNVGKIWREKLCLQYEHNHELNAYKLYS